MPGFHRVLYPAPVVGVCSFHCALGRPAVPVWGLSRCRGVRWAFPVSAAPPIRGGVCFTRAGRAVIYWITLGSVASNPTDYKYFLHYAGHNARVMRLHRAHGRASRDGGRGGGTENDVIREGVTEKRVNAL